MGKMERFKALKAMNELVKLLNDEEAYLSWINYIEDGADDDAIFEDSEYDETMKDAVSAFLRIMRIYGKSGFYLDGKVF